MSDRWERLTDLYHAAVALPADERAVLLAEECCDDPVLQADVARMIAAHDRASRGRTPPEPTSSDAPDRFGPFRILKEIGHGPTSTVYLAARDDGRFKQRVAVKVIEGEMDPVFALERLRSAHQALSSSDNANVAWLIDSGTTEDGRPYAVMEYVQGESIDAYANARRLSIAERLDLFLKVCKGVSHAHRRHVHHGDLKPTNILVTSAGVKTAVGPNSLATSAPAEAGRSSSATRAPAATSRAAVARPRPEAPPVMTALTELNSMAGSS